MTISDMRIRGKQFLAKIPPGAVYGAILVLSSTGSFGLGILAAREMDLGEDRGFWVEEVIPASSLPASAVEAVSAQEEIPVDGNYVASKSGTRYYFPWCAGAKQIKEENKVWFETKEQAEAAGYTPAKNCKGI